MNQSESKQPIFEEYPVVDCNECKSYLSEECDGTPVGSEKVCKAFKATRRTDIPLQIKSLQKASKRLTRGLLMVSAAEILLSIGVLIIWLVIT